MKSKQVTKSFLMVKTRTMLTTANNRKHATRILAAANNPACLDSVGLYTIMLAQRIGMIACLLFVRNEQKEGEGEDASDREFQEKIRLIQEAGVDANVRVDYLITTGAFAEEVAKYLKIFDSPILIVGEGDCQTIRRKELRMVEEILMKKEKHHRNGSHHFLIVSGRSEPMDVGKDTSIQDWLTRCEKKM